METLRWSPQTREFLVFVRASGKPPSIEYAKPRSWDLLLSYYEAPSKVDQNAEMVTLGGPTKFSTAWEINRGHNDFLLSYKAVLFLDDDIEMRFEDIERLFTLFCDLNLFLAQPALTHHSHYSWPITLRCPSFRLRFTNFIEIMAPIFSHSALERCLDSFLFSVSGWGLDFVWPVLLGSPHDRIAIIDEITMTHTKVVDPKEGPFYQFLRELGIDPYREFEDLCTAYGLGPRPNPEHYGALLAGAEDANRAIRFVEQKTSD